MGDHAHRKSRFTTTVRITEARIENAIMRKQPVPPPRGLTSMLRPILIAASLVAATAT